jgi:AraC-like DNA-binding protein
MRIFKSQDRDEVQDHVGRMFCDHSMALVNARGQLDTRIASMHCGKGVSITEMQYGADVMIDAGRLENFYLVQIPVAGRARVTLGGVDAAYAPGTASVENPVEPMEMFWSRDCRKVVLRYERALFERFVEIYLGRPLRDAVRFAPRLDLASPAGQLLIDHLRSALAVLRSGAEADALPPLLETHLENTLMGALLFLQPHDHSSDCAGTVGACETGPVRRVREYLECHAAEPIDMAVLGEVAGIPVRTLYHQFQRAHGASPMQLLREIRLDRVRRELLAACQDANVTRVALGWGFDHLGRFAASYRQRFGETPRETLQRRRSRLA